MLYLISQEEMNDIENIRKELCNTSYLCHSHQTQRLYRITHMKRGLKFLVNVLKGGLKL